MKVESAENCPEIRSQQKTDPEVACPGGDFTRISGGSHDPPYNLPPRPQDNPLNISQLSDKDQLPEEDGGPQRKGDHGGSHAGIRTRGRLRH